MALAGVAAACGRIRREHARVSDGAVGARLLLLADLFNAIDVPASLIAAAAVGAAVGVGAEVVALGLEQAEDGCTDRLGYGGTPVPWAVSLAPEPRALGLLLLG